MRSAAVHGSTARPAAPCIRAVHGVVGAYCLEPPAQQTIRQPQPQQQQRQEESQATLLHPAAVAAAVGTRCAAGFAAAAQPRGWSVHHAHVLKSLRQQRMLPKGSRVLLAVSGGQDSMAMLRILLDLQQPKLWPLQLVVAHCDHQMRPDSPANAAFVQQQAQQMGLQYCQRTAEQQPLRSEESARSWRYEQLQQLAVQAGCSHVAVGHTTTDKAETMLFNLIRGAGAAGLSSMTWSRDMGGSSSSSSSRITLVRPLLGLTRECTAEVCQLTETQIWEDSTNNDQCYARNRLRLSVFPELRLINQQAVLHMAQASELLLADSLLLDRMALAVLQQIRQRVLLVRAGAEAAAAQQSGGGSSSGSNKSSVMGRHSSSAGTNSRETDALPVKALTKLPVALRQRVVKAWLSGQAPRAATYAMLAEVLLLAEQGAQGNRTSSLWAKHCVLRHQQLLLVVQDWEVQQLTSRQMAVIAQQQEQQEEEQRWLQLDRLRRPHKPEKADSLLQQQEGNAAEEFRHQQQKTTISSSCRCAGSAGNATGSVTCMTDRHPDKRAGSDADPPGI